MTLVLGGGDSMSALYYEPSYNELYHHGIKGMKWGVRRYQNKDGSRTKQGQIQYSEESNKKIKVNADGSKTIPKGFVFNRVGKSSLDFNNSGGLYVSYGKQDASRYIKSLGPTPIRKLFNHYGDTVQHITVKTDLKMPSDSEVAKETANILLSNEKLFSKFNGSLYSSVYTGELGKNVSKQDLKKALQNPLGKEGQRLSYSVNSFFGDPNYSKETSVIYDHFRKNGYDALPDVHDRLSGTSKTAMIIINPNKVSISSTTNISKDVMKSAKSYVKRLEKLPVSEFAK